MNYKVVKILPDGFQINYGTVPEEALNRILDTAKDGEEVKFEEVN